MRPLWLSWYILCLICTKGSGLDLFTGETDLIIKKNKRKRYRGSQDSIWCFLCKAPDGLQCKVNLIWWNMTPYLTVELFYTFSSSSSVTDHIELHSCFMACREELNDFGVCFRKPHLTAVLFNVFHLNGVHIVVFSSVAGAVGAD